jgi:hypothetical protein
MPGLLSLVTALSNGTLLTNTQKRKQNALILDLDPTGAPSGNWVQFQYYPETITDTKAVNWNAKEIPGGSLPIYQWVASGERAIGFTAVFTSDMDLYDANQGGTDLVNALQSTGAAGRNIDIRSALVWLRRFMLPTYGTPGTVGVPNITAPMFLQLILPGSAIGLTGGESTQTTNSSNQDQITALMNQCDVTYVQSFPSGMPRIVEVQLTFLQVAQFAGSGVEFPQYGGIGKAMDYAYKGDNSNFFGILGLQSGQANSVKVPTPS